MFSVKNEMDKKVGLEVYHFIGKVKLTCDCYMIDVNAECNIPEKPKDHETLMADPMKYQWDFHEVHIRAYGEKYQFPASLLFSELLVIETPLLLIEIGRTGSYPKVIIKPSKGLRETIAAAHSAQNKLVSPKVHM